MRIPLVGKAGKKPAPWLIGVLAAGAIAVPGTAFWASRQLTPRQAGDTATVAVEAKDVTVRISASGEVLPAQTVNLSPKAAGRIIELLVDQGDRVTQGQVVARMDSSDLEAERAQAQARIAEAQANLDKLRAGTRVEEVGQAQAELERARGEVQRVEGLVADARSGLDFARSQTERQRKLASEGAIAQNSLDEFLRKERGAQETVNQALAQRNQAQAQVDQATQQLAQRQNGARPEEIAQAEAQVANAVGQLQAVQTRIEDTLIRAPFSGVITQRYATVGAFVTPTTQASATADGATSTSIFALANGLEIKARVPEVDVGQIKTGQTVEVKVDAYPEDTFKGRVKRIAPEAVTVRDVTSFEVRIEILTGANKLRSKMNADVEFLGDQVRDAVVIPTAALSTRKGKTGVWIPGEKEPKFQTVTTGQSFDNDTQILDGLKQGDRIYLQPPEGKKLGKPDEQR